MSPFCLRRFTHRQSRDRPRALRAQLKSVPSPIGMLSAFTDNVPEVGDEVEVEVEVEVEDKSFE